MFLHLHLPGFQAVAHQVYEPNLRRRPVVVAVSLAEHAPVLACSYEAWAGGLRPGMRLGQTRQRMPEVQVRLPDADRARRMQASIASAALAFSPLVSSTPGRWDVDLDGTETFWSTRLNPRRQIADPAIQALTIADAIGKRILDDLGQAPCIGIAAHPLAARLAALRATRELGRSNLLLIRPEDEARAIDVLPVHDLPTGTSLLDQLVYMGCLTIGDVRRLGADGLSVTGGIAGRALHAALMGQDQLLPSSLDGEAHLSACTGTIAGGADEQNVLQLLQTTAQQLGHHLRRYHVAATRLSLTVKWGIGATRQVIKPLAYQVRANRDLIHIAESLLVKAGEHHLPWSWLRLTATGLVTAEDQQDIFTLTAPPWQRAFGYPHRAEVAGAGSRHLASRTH